MNFLGKEHIVSPFVTALDAGFEIDAGERRRKAGKAIDAVFLGDFEREGVSEKGDARDWIYFGASRALLRAPSALIGAIVGNVGCAVLRAPFQGSDY